jgi:cobalt-precorrin-5B (C1)-methyltransferase
MLWQSLRQDKMGSKLRTGYTTGACAAAAAKGAALMLAHQMTVREVSITLPNLEIATFHLHGQLFSTDQASCYVVKDAGDDPDVTNGAEVHAAVRRAPDSSRNSVGIVIEGGKGIGRVTKPGLAVPPGEWAINPVPQAMIKDAVFSVFPPLPLDPCPLTLKITISIPDGEERATKTLNKRLGIIGGLSILGTTGIVRPISARAWTDTIDAALDVAKACDCKTVVLSTGRTSEMAVQEHFRVKGQGSRNNKKHSGSELPLFAIPLPLAPCSLTLPEEAYIMMGDHIAYTLRACLQRGFRHPIVSCQFAKLLKIACGHENTHAAASELDITRLLEWARSGGLPETILEIISNANTAREIALACSFSNDLIELVIRHATSAAGIHAPGISPQFMIADYSGNCVFTSR